MRWSRSSWRSTPRWPTRPVKRATRVPLSPLPPNQCNTSTLRGTSGGDNDCGSICSCFFRRMCVCVCACAAQGDQSHRIRNPSGGGNTFSSAC
jgi:hypothetical protein